MRLRQFGSMAGLAALAACTSVNSSGIVAMGPDMYGMKVASRNLAGAAEKGLTDATTFCNAMGRQTQLLRTQITNDDYQLVFRCTGGAPVAARPAAPVQVPSIAGVPIPNPNAPVLAGAAFPPQQTVGELTAQRLAAQQARAPIFPVSAPLLTAPATATLPPLQETPVAPLMLGRPGRGLPPAPIAAPAAPLPLAASPPGGALAPLASPYGAEPAAAEPPRRGFFGRMLNVFGSDEPAPRAPLPAPGPLDGGGFTTPPQPGGIFPVGPAAGGTAPQVPPASGLEPLRSPLAPGGLGAGAPLAPLAAPAPLPRGAAPATTPALAPLTAPAALPAVAEPPPRSLPPVPLQPLPRLNTNVPGTLPPPATGGQAPTLPQPVSTEPPTGFWSTFRS